MKNLHQQTLIIVFTWIVSKYDGKKSLPVKITDAIE